MRTCEVVYVNTGDVEALPEASGKMHVPISLLPGFGLIGGWELGVDSDSCDVPGVRISAQLQVCHRDEAETLVTDEILGDYLYRSPGRALRGAPVLLPAPYRLDGEPYLFVKVKTTDTPVKARAAIYVWLLGEED